MLATHSPRPKPDASATLVCPLQVRSFAKRWAQAAKHKDTSRHELLLLTGNCVRDPETGLLCVAPAVDGRIRIVAGGA